MAKKNIKKATKQLATETAAKRPTAPAGMALQTVTPVAKSKPIQSPAQQVQDAPAKAVAARDSLTTAAQPEPVKSREKVAVVAEAPVVSKVPTVKVTFVLPTCPCCPKRVSLSGDFNGWSPDATPMKRYDDGHWETTIELAPGRYEYKFVRDGEWMPDLLARENVLNGYGTLNSVIEVRPDNR
jgi:hypothetical protein